VFLLKFWYIYLVLIAKNKIMTSDLNDEEIIDRDLALSTKSYFFVVILCDFPKKSYIGRDSWEMSFRRID